MPATPSAAQTVRTARHGPHDLRLVRHGGLFHGIAPGLARVADADADRAWALLTAAVARSDPRWTGHDGARARFLSFFPGGFADPVYVAQERAYKLRAREMLLRTVPLEAARAGQGFGEAVLKVCDATNILSPVEKMRLRDLLRGPDADGFVQAAAAFAAEPDAAGLARLARLLKPHAGLRWLAATYLPFLWLPEARMLLKPRVTVDFAARIGHRFAQDYAAELRFEVWSALADLAAETRAALADLGPRDGIDIQSFIWVVGSYRPGDGQPAP